MKMRCSICKKTIKNCDSICAGEFKKDDAIICWDNGDAHLHEDCLDEWIEPSYNSGWAEDKESE